MPGGWEGNRRWSSVTLATRHRHQWFSAYGLKAWKREMSTPLPTLCCGAWLTLSLSQLSVLTHRCFVGDSNDIQLVNSLAPSTTEGSSEDLWRMLSNLGGE